MINQYEFGLITVGGKSYKHDVVVFWDGVVQTWLREESHIIGIGDVQLALAKNPETIVIGTGEGGAATVSDEAKKEIVAKGIILAIEDTKKASAIFNENAARGKKIAGLFHLTC